MRIKLYRAASVAEAMERVRVELGNDALIIGTRPVGGGMEVTAALETESDVATDAARAALEFHRVPPALRDALQAGELAASLADALAFSPLPLATGSAPLLVVGPPGAGKTLTVARLATRLVMTGGTPKVITSDGKRAGAVEQLAAFTRLLGINLVVAHRAQSISRALAMGEGDPVLIDSAGSDPFDAGQCEELRNLACAAGALTVLVLPAGLDSAEAADLAEAYSGLGAKHLVVTRVDVARRLGGLLAAASVPGLALSEAGVGPGAADGLRPIDPSWLADRLLAIPVESRA